MIYVLDYDDKSTVCLNKECTDKKYFISIFGLSDAWKLIVLTFIQDNFQFFNYYSILPY